MKRRVASSSLRLQRPLSLDECQVFHDRIFDAAFGHKACTPPQLFAKAYLDQSVGSKFCESSADSAASRSNAAIAKFLLAERMCRKTNGRLRPGVPVPYKDWDLNGVLYLAEKKIHQVLGSFSWSEARESMDFGPGATHLIRRGTASRAAKFDHRVETYLTSYLRCCWAVAQSPLWYGMASAQEPYLAPANRVITVPKSSVIDRVIAIEPSTTMYCQKGIGKMIRRRLARVGCDLNDQTQNGEFARLGSLFGNLATVDLSMASDTIAYWLVRRLLPADWFDALNELRAERGVLPSGEFIAYQKFSSMGNGYTFELESLIFWAICSCVIETLGLKDRRLGVYGDDIVISVHAKDLLERVLDYAGFKVNTSKSHWEGPFRESCGKHYHSGVEVTPFYVRRPLDNVPDLFTYHNNLRRWIDRWRIPPERYGAVRGILREIRARAPAMYERPTLPLNSEENTGFIGSFDEARPSLCIRHKKRGWSGYSVPSLVLLELPNERGTLGRLLASVSRDPNSTWGYDAGGARDPLLVQSGLSLPRGRLAWFVQPTHVLQ